MPPQLTPGNAWNSVPSTGVLVITRLGLSPKNGPGSDLRADTQGPSIKAASRPSRVARAPPPPPLVSPHLASRAAHPEGKGLVINYWEGVGGGGVATKWENCGYKKLFALPSLKTGFNLSHPRPF